MPLPDLIEIVPLDKPVRAEITVPGSKSITNRALILAALADGEVALTGALWSEDTQVMTEALVKLGFEIKVDPDPEEFCNRRITVRGQGGKILPPGGTGTPERPLELFVGNAGTVARFLAAMVCLGNGVYRLSGVQRMHERPQAALFKALRELGYRVDSANDKLPASFHGAEPLPRRTQTIFPKYKDLLTDPFGSDVGRKCAISIEQSSQFASALLLCAKVGGWKISVVGEDAEESPYVAMTTKLIEAFPNGGGRFQIEPDASSGSYFLAAGGFGETPEHLEFSEEYGTEVRTIRYSNVSIVNWPATGWQVDERFPGFLAMPGVFHECLEFEASGRAFDQKAIAESVRNPKQIVSRASDLGDSIMTAIVITTLDYRWNETLRFTDLGRLRVQECERVVALRTELTKCGAKVIEEGDTLTVYPSQLHGAEIETYNDHRMAMCFAILGLKVPGIKLQNPACVKKTFPNFFQKLAAPPPKGLGATILDGRTGRKLELDELFAE
ncbi:MAG: 3-phosphoshikimate 1-carboxyvinyltransferase [Pedosphaera sp.]|nr:3-phosphoshikimate 1-carboxyvinyltransferase [Pedosphaera sp.]